MSDRAGPVLDVQQLYRDEQPELAAFDDVAVALVDGLRRAGVDSEHRRGMALGTRPRVLLGCHVLSDDELRSLPDDTTIYNFEQLTSGSPLPPSRLGVLAGRPVWEFARPNLDAWAAAGIAAAHVPLGWSPALRRLDRTRRRDLDVLFYGSPHPRRQAVVDALREAGATANLATGAFGEVRDRLVERSRVVLNIPYFPTPVLETVRLSFLLHNGVPVVSEVDDDTVVPPAYADAAVFARREDVVDATLALLADDERLAGLEQRAVAAMRSQPWRFPAAVLTSGLASD